MTSTMRQVIGVVIVMVAAVLQAAICPTLPWLNARPDILLSAIVPLCLYAGSVRGAACGFAAGLLCGSLSGGFLGTTLVTWTATGWMVGGLGNHVFRDNLLVVVGVGIVTTLALAAMHAVSAPEPQLGVAALRTLVEGGANGLLVIPFYLFTRRMVRHRPL